MLYTPFFKRLIHYFVVLISYDLFVILYRYFRRGDAVGKSTHFLVFCQFCKILDILNYQSLQSTF
jgi:hypothetical protein